MAVGLSDPPSLHPVAGVRLGVTMAGIRKIGRRDLVVIECVPGTTAAAVFTQSRAAAAPVQVARSHLAKQAPRSLVINTGYANAATGEPGIADANATCAAVAAAIGCQPGEVLPFSTGVIGERLPIDRLIAAVPRAVGSLSETAWADAANGIMTTDTIAKGASRRLTIGGRNITVTGIAKGAGMIQPNMATMLAFVATDAPVERDTLAACLKAAVEASFNRITVDGDTSTNDACVLLATGKAGGDRIDRTSGETYERLRQAVTEVCIELAQAIVRDAEGATKFITVEVIEGASDADCLQVAYTIANSPLVKTAFFASDPNWGRLLMAIGRAPAGQLEISRVGVWINDVCVVRYGARAAEYTEAAGQAAMRPAEIRVRVSLGQGRHTATVWTSDLSHEYVRINAEYRS